MGCLGSRTGKEGRTCNYISGIWIPLPRDLLCLMLAWTTKYQGSFRFSGAKIWNTHSCMWDTQTEEYQHSRLVLLSIKHGCLKNTSIWTKFVGFCGLLQAWMTRPQVLPCNPITQASPTEILISPWGEWVRWCVIEDLYGVLFLSLGTTLTMIIT